MTEDDEIAAIRERKRRALEARATAPEVPAEPVHLTDPAEFDDLVSRHPVVLVDFYADWCGPCRMMEPHLETIAAETDAAVVKVDTDRFQGLAGRFGVRSLPTVLVFANGEPADRAVGAQSEVALRRLVEAHLD